MPRLSGWKLADNKLSRTFEFQDFVQSLSFINDGRVTDRDVEVAKKISSVYRARS
jgi:pterin-4a-carbinolamine dehydratase